MVSPIKLGVGLDNCLINTTEAFRIYKKRFGANSDSFLDSKFVKDESFFLSLHPYDDVPEAARRLSEAGVEVYVLTERPQLLLPTTRAWLKVVGFVGVDFDHIIPKTIKRYDSRLHGLSVLCDTDLKVLDTFIYDETNPVYIRRQGRKTPTNPRVKTFATLKEAVWELT